MPTTAKHHRWDDLPRERLNSRLERRLITGTNMMVAHVYLEKGCIVPQHSHHNEQITYVLEGALKFLLGEDQQQVRPGQYGESAEQTGQSTGPLFPVSIEIQRHDHKQNGKRFS